jgi:hypothetical protein
MMAIQSRLRTDPESSVSSHLTHTHDILRLVQNTASQQISWDPLLKLLLPIFWIGNDEVYSPCGIVTNIKRAWCLRHSEGAQYMLKSSSSSLTVLQMKKTAAQKS